MPPVVIQHPTELGEFISLLRKCAVVDKREGCIITRWTSNELYNKMLSIFGDNIEEVLKVSS